jgi:hypothetical protein
VHSFELTRHDEPDVKARAAGLAPKPLLKSDPAAGSILLDSETSAARRAARSLGLPAGQPLGPGLGAGSAQGKKAQGSDHPRGVLYYRFADHKEKVIDLLQRVVMVSVKTVKVVQAMQTRALIPATCWHRHYAVLAPPQPSPEEEGGGAPRSVFNQEN